MDASIATRLVWYGRQRYRWNPSNMEIETILFMWFYCYRGFVVTVDQQVSQERSPHVGGLDTNCVYLTKGIKEYLTRFFHSS